MLVTIFGWSPPERKLTLSFQTPITVKLPPTLLPLSEVRVIALPSASSSPKSCCLALVLRITTGAAERDSCSVNMRPSCMSGGLIAGQFAPTPRSWTLESSLSRYRDCTLHPICGITSATELSRPIASISVKVIRGLERHLHVSSEPSHASNVMGQRFT